MTYSNTHVVMYTHDIYFFLCIALREFSCLIQKSRNSETVLSFETSEELSLYFGALITFPENEHFEFLDQKSQSNKTVQNGWKSWGVQWNFFFALAGIHAMPKLFGIQLERTCSQKNCVKTDDRSSETRGGADLPWKNRGKKHKNAPHPPKPSFQGRTHAFSVSADQEK